MILFIGDNDPAAARGDKNKVRMPNAQPLAPVRPDFIGHERRGTIEFTDGLDQHGAQNVTPSSAVRKTAARGSASDFGVKVWPIDVRITEMRRVELGR